MLNKIAFPWQALASCDGFISFLDNLLATDGLLPEEKAVRMPLLLAQVLSFMVWFLPLPFQLVSFSRSPL